MGVDLFASRNALSEKVADMRSPLVSHFLKYILGFQLEQKTTAP